MNNTNYSEVSHYHCFEKKEHQRHLACCLCGMKPLNEKIEAPHVGAESIVAGKMKEFRKKFYHTKVLGDFTTYPHFEGTALAEDIESFLSQSLTATDTQARKEERESICKRLLECAEGNFLGISFVHRLLDSPKDK